MSLEVLLVVEQLRRAVAGEVSGIGTYTLGLLQGLRELGDEGPRVALHASRATATPDPLLEHGLPLRTSRLPGRLLTRAWDRELLGPPADGADVVHATSLAFPAAGKGPPLTVMVHDVAWREVPEAYPRRGRRWHEAALQRALASAARLVVPARAAADALVAAGASAATVEVIPEGADHLPPADLDGAQRILDRLGVREGFLLTVATLQPRKNLARLAWRATRGPSSPSSRRPWSRPTV
jgi:glycosyltransferase involved in cell wall biosynthesis